MEETIKYKGKEKGKEKKKKKKLAFFINFRVCIPLMMNHLLERQRKYKSSKTRKRELFTTP